VSGTVSSLASLSTLITKGTTPTTLGYAHSDSGIPFLRVQNIFGGQVNFEEDTLFIGEDTHAALKRSQIQGGDVLVTIAGTIGRTGVVPLDAPSMNCNQAVAIVRPTAQIERSYLRHWLESQAARSQMIGSTVTGTISNLSLTQLGELQVPLPSLEEQRRIAAILDQAETLRTQRRQALAHLDTLTQSLFLDMFGDDAQGAPRFPVAALVDVLETPLQNGAYYPKEEYTEEGGVEMVHMSDAFNGIVQRGGLRRVNCSDADLKRYALGVADILLARRSLTYEGAAKPCLIPPATEPLLFESSFIRVTPDRKKLLPLYMFHYLNNETIRDKRVRPFVTQSTISGINQSNLERVPVVVPPLALQQTFATRIQAIEALKATHRTALTQLDALFASLQQRAFAGEL